MNAIEETYDDVKGMIFKMVRKHADRFGGEFSEVLSDAHCGFMAAYGRFDGRGQFTTWCGCQIRYELLDAYYRPNGSDNKAKFDRTVRNNSKALDEVIGPVSFNLGAFAGELSRDAQTAITIALDLPRVEDPSKLKRELLRHLQQKLGWTAARCVETFTEERGAL